MKRVHKAAADELRKEYRFDYSKARRNPYASLLKGREIAVVLEPDVAAVFRTSKVVNEQLRAVLAAIPRKSKRVARRSRRSKAR